MHKIHLFKEKMKNKIIYLLLFIFLSFLALPSFAKIFNLELNDINYTITEENEEGNKEEGKEIKCISNYFTSKIFIVNILFKEIKDSKKHTYLKRNTKDPLKKIIIPPPKYII